MKNAFIYRLNGENRHYLLMPEESKELRRRIKLLGIERVFAAWTGKSMEGITDLKLITEEKNYEKQ